MRLSEDDPAPFEEDQFTEMLRDAVQRGFVMGTQSQHRYTMLACTLAAAGGQGAGLVLLLTT